MCSLRLLAIAITGFALAGQAAIAPKDTLELGARARVRRADGTVVIEPRWLAWDPRATAVVVCDMWDRHWCRGATARVAEMAPRMNEFLKAARGRGMLVVHAPSETMPFYADTPQRRRALEAPKASPGELNQWKSLRADKEPDLPIDDSDGGCDDSPPCPQGGPYPWRREIATLEMGPDDVVTDQGDEIENVFRAAGIRNVLVLGVHANMCVLGRPFAIRALVGRGYQVALVRDLTDTMYNSRAKPKVSHFTGTDLIVEHIETWWCPSVTSSELLPGAPFRFSRDSRKTVVLIIGENEYRTSETLPAFAASELVPRGMHVEHVLSSTNTDDVRFVNWPAIANADLLIVSTRRRTPRRELLDLIRAHLTAGRPLVGLRTACHGFAPRTEQLATLSAHPELGSWPEFDPEVLGGHYTDHYGSGSIVAVTVVKGQGSHPILEGVGPFTSTGSLYRCSPLAAGTQELLHGTIPGAKPEPVAWTRNYGPSHARVFFTSLGHPSDFAQPEFRRLLGNGVAWALAGTTPR